MYAWFYEDPFHSIFLTTTTILSFISNGLLLYIIFTTKFASIGSYRYLLDIFAVCDVMTSCGHACLQPMIHMMSSGVSLFPRYGEMIIAGFSCDTLFCLIFIATYFQTFLVLAYHFVYRFKCVSSGIIRSCTDFWSPSMWTRLGIAVNIIYLTGVVGTCIVAFTPSQETRYFRYLWRGKYPRRGYTTIAVKRPDNRTGSNELHGPSIAALTVLVGLFGSTASAIIFCIWRVNGVISSPDNHLTEKTRKMQSDLFRALLIQTAVPLFISYIPLSIILPPITGMFYCPPHQYSQR